MVFDININTDEINEKGGKALEDIGDSFKEVSGALTSVLELKCSKDKVDLFRSLMSDFYEKYHEQQSKQNSRNLLAQYISSINELESLVNKQIDTLKLSKKIGNDIDDNILETLQQVVSFIINYRNKAIAWKTREVSDNSQEFDEIQELESESHTWTLNPFMWMAYSAGGISLTAISYYFPGLITRTLSSASNTTGHLLSLINTGASFWPAGNSLPSNTNPKEKETLKL